LSFGGVFWDKWMVTAGVELGSLVGDKKLIKSSLKIKIYNIF
jgi:hypothetical protein